MEEVFDFLEELQRSINQMAAVAKPKTVLNVIQRFMKITGRGSSRK